MYYVFYVIGCNGISSSGIKAFPFRVSFDFIRVSAIVHVFLHQTYKDIWRNRGKPLNIKVRKCVHKYISLFWI